MIQVSYYPNIHKITVKGHANSAPFGEDLVCAAASALALTLAVNIRELEQLGEVKKVVKRLGLGDAEISCVPDRSAREKVTEIMDVVSKGYEALANTFRDYIKFEKI